MNHTARNSMRVAPGHQPLMRELGLDVDTVFAHPSIRVWRSLPERENAVLDAAGPDGAPIRLHVKRYAAMRGSITPAQNEATGIQLLSERGIPTVPLVAWGARDDGRSFLITEDLAGYAPADKWIGDGGSFERLLEPSAALAARLHEAGLHHRDFYLCHVFVQAQPEGLSLRLIDAGRVKQLPGWPFRRRWIVKDLAQFWYSTLVLPITEAQRRQWLARYAAMRGLGEGGALPRSIQRKSRQIARHDEKLRRRQPGRNISLDDGASS